MQQIFAFSSHQTGLTRWKKHGGKSYNPLRRPSFTNPRRKELIMKSYMKWDIIEDDPENSFSLFEVFKDMEDPRIERHKLYPLEEILFVTICAMICGSESWRDIHDFGNTKIDFLRQYMKFENGIPSKSTIARVFSLLNPLQFRAVFTAWIKEFQKEIEENEVIATN
jgi:hypothetical protein